MKRRILFVDDEPQVLHGLRRMLREQGRQWEMEFAEGGDAALRRLESEPFDAVVTDMRMPGMDGVALLEAIRIRRPSVVRIVLSGHSAADSIYRTVGLAHLFLAKPCDPADLVRMIERACVVGHLVDSDRVREIVGQVDALPALPDTCRRLMAELSTPEPSIRAIAEVVGRDPGVSAKILQLVNSAFFGLPRPLASPADAVMLLGLDTIKALVFSVGLFQSFERDRSVTQLVEELQLHSMGVSTVTRRILEAEAVGRAESETAVVAAFLHDVGKLVLARQFGGVYATLLRSHPGGGTPLCAAEINAFGASHARVGAYLLGLWGLSSATVEAVAFHHEADPGGDGGVVVAAVLNAADRIQHAAGAAPDLDGLSDAGAHRLLAWHHAVSRRAEEAA